MLTIEQAGTFIAYGLLIVIGAIGYLCGRAR